MTIRERMERMEHEMLSPYAALSDFCKGRDYPEAPCDIRPVYRETETVFSTVRHSAV